VSRRNSCTRRRRRIALYMSCIEVMPAVCSWKMR
jgi:hypothetical protein